jgi:hypothetical protein
VIAGDPALRWLARHKLRATVRRQLRRLRTPKGALLGLLGAALIFWWLVPLAFVGRAPPSPVSFAASVRFTLAVLVFSSLASAFAHRGLYLPKEEIELLFAAPVRRSDVVRYRLLAALGRSLWGAGVIGIVAATRAPVPLYGFAGAVTAALTLPILAQAASLLLGGAENEIARRAAKFPWRGVQVALVLALLAGFVQLALAARDGRRLDAGAAASWIEALVRHPAARAAFAPLEPWVRAITAESAAAFAPAWLACAAVLALLFELSARLRVDFRELSLETSADVARRLERLRRGQAQTSATRRGFTAFDVPWVFGRGPFGALAWRRLTGMARKARGAAASALVMSAATVALSIVIAGSRREDALAGSLVVAATGTLYLAAGLRFDFREDLALMSSVKAWPIERWKLFVATLVPETLLVSAFIVAALFARAAITGHLPPAAFAIAAGVPFAVFTWTAIDNAAFLFAPVRVIAGQEGPLQNAGRALLLMLMRFAALAAVVALAWIGYELARALARLAGLAPLVGRAAGVTVALATLLGACAALVLLGGELLRRFDPARDRG